MIPLAGCVSYRQDGVEVQHPLNYFSFRKQITRLRLPGSRNPGIALVSATSLMLASAAAAQESSAVTEFRFPPIFVALVALGALVAAVVAVLSHRSGWGARVTSTAAIIAVFAGLLIAPSMAADRIRVTPTRIEQRTGLWFAQTKKGFDYQQVQSVRIGSRISRRRKQTIWYLRRQDGGETALDPGDLWDLKSNEIVPLLERYGVTFE